jgi:hypothetical protein
VDYQPTPGQPRFRNGVIPSEQGLRNRLQSQYGNLTKHGWRVKLKWRFGYISPEAWYEAVVDRLVTNETTWIDVGGRKGVFSHNEKLSKNLAM